MPELPEVETMLRDVARPLIGRTIVAIDLRLPKAFRPAGGLRPADLVGRTIVHAYRRAKMLAVDLSGDLTLLLHMRLTGQLAVERPDGSRVAAGHPVPAFGAPLPHRSTHLILTLDDGSRLFFTDLRQLGFLLLMPAAEVPGFFRRQGYGVEPLRPEFTTEAFQELLRRRPRTKMKPFLLDQSLVAGVGNIYADEALWLAGIHPLREAGSLPDAEARRLHHAIVDVLSDAVKYGVAQVLGGKALGRHVLPRVHGRAGEPCFRCGTPIERITLGGRSTYFCPACQPLRATEAPRGMPPLPPPLPTPVSHQGGRGENIPSPLVGEGQGRGGPRRGRGSRPAGSSG
ncbi:MAG: bifunctional DNA-formamidopyrimidine glycosylase/DNA-(apurinic or apyrimidinic site) lyase [Chloroflexi bacterium]|nr:bifunctional DNA-formamidopyrimidine glycosylase/DNA-(apurinic or apyrimidinic site) lyase [Chloroflexota bacterium]